MFGHLKINYYYLIIYFPVFVTNHIAIKTLLAEYQQLLMETTEIY